MQLRIYNENGTVKVTRLDEKGVEKVIVSNIQSGQAVEMKIFDTSSFHVCLNGILVKD